MSQQQDHSRFTYIRDDGCKYATQTLAAAALGVSQGVLSWCLRKGRPCEGHRFTVIPVQRKTRPRPAAQDAGLPVICVESGDRFATCWIAAEFCGLHIDNADWIVGAARSGGEREVEGLHFVFADERLAERARRAAAMEGKP